MFSGPPYLSSNCERYHALRHVHEGVHRGAREDEQRADEGRAVRGGARASAGEHLQA